ncbi:YjbH domain-containing protein [Variovorax ginsengisoli]|uniref:Capsule biosynthesis GfcC-like C-terminal domain-containing protein n=1 Tax=Variovorax ginsengisoli TaxID=363844 RepID=A0ABT9SF95_9BURK|nr:YjbH domain-containing protein [Variovorax ginsengisoli]MDP9903040.1 hypothetical protein [Variovorax ginsengisoli]
MTTRTHAPRFLPQRSHVAAACLLLATCAAHAQTPAANATTPTGLEGPGSVRAGERLSDWLQRQPAEAATPGLSWLVPQERLAQQFLKNTLLVRLETSVRRLPAAEAASRQQLLTWLQQMPVTGRVALGQLDASYLQTHPAQDPVLVTGQQLIPAPRADTVAVVRPNGDVCQVAHTAGRLALDYAQACGMGDATDFAWVAQPDGRTARVGVASWNAAPSDEPAPGAWIWAPPRSMPDLVAISEGMVRFLATQGPSPLQRLVPAGAALTTTDPAAAPPPAPVPLPVPATTISVRPEVAPQYQRVDYTGNDWGEIGLLQTPTARMAKAGEFRASYTHVAPYSRLNVMFQPLDWLEGGFRYTSISNRIYGISDQDYKDKSIDVKARLWQESAYLPEVALGFRDVGGTGLFSSEYFVGSKRVGDFDFSLGMGWGYMANSGNISNPFKLLGDRFATRPASNNSVTVSGKTNFGNYFRGPAALFGGVEWRTPWEPLTLKVEYDGNDYKNEPLSNSFDQRTPINVGLVYRLSPGVEFSAGIERGNKVMFGVTLSTNLAQASTTKVADPATPRFVPQAPAQSPGWPTTAADIESRTGWLVERIAPQGESLHVWITESNTVYREARVEQITAVLHRDAPASVKNFVLHFSERGIPMHAQVVDRTAWVTAHYQALPPSAAREPIQREYAPAPEPQIKRASMAAANGSTASADASTITGPWTRPRDNFSFGITPSITQILGGPDGFLLYQIGVQASAEYRFTSNTWANGSVNARLLDNYDKFTYTAPSNLPRVRTYQREYVTSSRVTIPNLQLTHAGQLSENQYFSMYGGALESMFAGVGGEWLYRPWHSRVAFGVDVNHVRQRGFDQDFSLRDYKVNTGHATLYWDTGWYGVLAKVSAGQYLAGDRGVTVDISRRFDNGVAIGAYATKTNVSAAQFGEGSFDKGIYISIPFDALLPRSSSFVANFNWVPVTRDGGAKLARSNTLYEMTSARDPRAFSMGPPKADTPNAGDNILDFDKAR